MLRIQWFALLLGALLIPASQASTIYTSYPSSDIGHIGANEHVDAMGALFTVGDGYFQVDRISVPLAYSAGYNLEGETPPQPPPIYSLPVNYEIWSSSPFEFTGDNRERPSELLGTWQTGLVPPSASPGTQSFWDIVVSVSDGPILHSNTNYWLVVRTGWSNVNRNANIQWAGSSSVTGNGHGFEMIQTATGLPDFPSPYANIDPGNFVAFQIEGTLVSSVPEPATYLSLLLGLGVVVSLARRRQFIALN